MSEALGTRLSSLAKSAGSVLWPVDGHVCDAFFVTSMASPRALAGLAIFGLSAWLAHLRRGPALLLLLSLLPSLQLVPVMRWWSPHYVYLPLAFAVMVAAEAVERWNESALRWAGPLSAALAVLSWLAAPRYRSDEALWTREVRAEPACSEGHFYLAAAAHAAGRPEMAADHYERSLDQAPNVLSYVDRGAALQNLGVLRLEQERFQDASSMFRAALELRPSDDERRKLIHNLATAELGAGNPAEAAALLADEVARPDALPASIFVRARAVQALGRDAEAAALYARLPHAPR